MLLKIEVSPFSSLSILLYIVHLSFDEHLGCLQTLDIVNHAAMNKEVQISLWDVNFLWLHTQQRDCYKYAK